MTPDSIIDLAERLAQDEDLHQDYLVRKLGYDPDIQSEFDKAAQILIGKGIILPVTTSDSSDEQTYTTWPQICLMTNNLTVDGYNQCVSEDPTSDIFNAKPKAFLQ